ncbi:ethylene-responsive transcription factor ERF024-like [Prosopis cineraria]|uniref:ethylene-responsive transcription factor ERF024-like n=1 Tax=Prosopis cineraria TaxID=364024 RepID=UPI002410578B|nr:ethylene-responsive transcription factor ERF024-like [Prosopis cineraria]
MMIDLLALLPFETDGQNANARTQISECEHTFLPSNKRLLSCSKRHPLLHGIRCRGEKWVSEIREPRKPSIIWPGTFASPEMAVVAYDVAVLALKGKDAVLNWPELAERYPVPVSTSAPHIRQAAAASASLVNAEPISNVISNISSISSTWSGTVHQFVDEDAIFGTPGLLLDMAEGMLLSPPRITPPSSDNLPADCLWNYF